MRAAIVALLCMGFVCGKPALADLDEGAYAPDIEAEEWINTDEPISLIELRGMVVVLFFWASWEPAGNVLLPAMNDVQAQFTRARGVYIIGLTDADRARVWETIDEKEVRFPIGLGSESYREYDINQFPRVVVIDPVGRVQWSDWPFGSGGGSNTLTSAISDVIEETPPTKTHPLDAARAHRLLKQARRALEEGEINDALDDALFAYDAALVGDQLKTRCQNLVDALELMGRDRLAVAEGLLLDEKYAEAVALLREIKEDFRGGDVGVAASRLLKTVQRENVDVAVVIRERRQEGLAGNALYDAVQLIRDKKFGPAYQALQQILEDYADTEAADQAQTILARMRDNEDLMGWVRDYLAEADSRTWLSQGDAFRERRLYDRAREYYRRVIENHPGTKWAYEARKRLALLPRY